MLNKENGEPITNLEALDFIYRSCRNLQGSADDHERLKIAYAMIRKYLTKESSNANTKDD